MRYTLAALSVSFIGFIIYSANAGNATYWLQSVNSIQYADKVLHFLLFGGLSFVLNWAFEHRRVLLRNRRLYIGTLVVGVYMIGDEFSHRFLPNRNFDYYDLIANFLGLVFFALLTALMFKRRAARNILRT